MAAPVSLDSLSYKIPKQDARFHQESVADILRRPNTNFPGAQPVSFARKHLLELQNVDYYVAEKTDGIRCLLYLTEIIGEDGVPQEAQFLIDRKNDYYMIERGYLHIPRKNYQPGPENPKPYIIEKWYRNTILDGELVRDRYPNGKEQLTFLIFDALALDGESITHRPFDQRLGKIGNVIDPWKAFAKDWPEDAAAQPFQLQRKNPQLGYGMEMMFREVVPKLTHGNDGLIFTCLSTPYTAGTDQHILKWKPPHENTIDFRLQLGSFPLDEDDDGSYEDFDKKPHFELLIYHGDRDYRHFADLYLTDEEWETMKSMNESFDWRIIECWRERETGNWRPKLDDGKPRFRDDKDHANHVSTVNSVLESIEDAVSEQDLLNAAGRIKASWKERAAKKKQEDQKRHEAMKAHQVKKEAKKEENDAPGYED